VNKLRSALLPRSPTSKASPVPLFAEVREAIGYRTRGLTGEIEAARQTLQAAGVTVLTEFDTTPVADLLSADEETALSLALREAVTNIVRHANATTCRLGFIADGAHCRLVIHDDGQNVIIREGNGLRAACVSALNLSAMSFCLIAITVLAYSSSSLPTP
jgi:hypothetical protein